MRHEKRLQSAVQVAAVRSAPTDGHLYLTRDRLCLFVMQRAKAQRFGTRTDYGRRLAQFLCMIFGLLGALPLGGGLLVRSDPVKEWAARETARILREHLGLSAQYSVQMQIWPLRLSLQDVVVPASDGGSPVLEAESVVVTPRIFSLLAGRLDVGDIEIEQPRVRLVFQKGKLKNLSYRLPESQSRGRRFERAPFSSLAVTEARADLDWDDFKVRAGPLDVDVFAEPGLAFEVALRGAETTIVHRRPRLGIPNGAGIHAGRPEHAVDEDQLCRMDVRLRTEPGSLLVRRLSLLGIADQNVEAGTRPRCNEPHSPHDANRLALRLSQFRVREQKDGAPVLDGHVVLQAPLSLTNRFIRALPVHGTARFAGDMHFDAVHRLPRLSGRIRGEGIAYGGYRLAETLDADIRVKQDRVFLPRYEMRFADGHVKLQDAVVEPFAEGVPLTARRVDGKGMRFEGLMRDLDVTQNTIVKWELMTTRVTDIKGTLSPLKLDADLWADTKNFEVFDRAFHDPRRRHMIGVKRATVKAKIGVRPNSFDIYAARAVFGNSSLGVKLVSIGFDNQLELTVDPGSRLDLSDASPLVDIEMSGRAELSVQMAGVASDPLLEGELKVQDFAFGGFPLGQIESSKVRFRPLKVDVSQVVAKKGSTHYRVPSARLDFDTDSSIKVDADVRTTDLHLRDFFAMWHFDEDPRFDEIDGRGSAEARVHYALGGREDRCNSGRLRVDGALALDTVELFEEHYDQGQTDFDFRWEDIDASYLGIDLDVSNVTLRKGKGVLMGAFDMRQGAKLRGQFVGTQVPLREVNALGSLGQDLSGTASGVAELSGSIDALQVNSNVRLSPVRIGSGQWPASTLSVRLEPLPVEVRSEGKTVCGHPKPTPFDPAEYARDRQVGTFVVHGKLFNDQVAVEELRVSRQRSKRVSGRLVLNDFDLGTALQMAPMLAAGDAPPSGRATGIVELERVLMERPLASTVSLQLSDLHLGAHGYRLSLASGPSSALLRSGRLVIPELAFSVETPQGPRGFFDAAVIVDDLAKQPTIDADLKLRQTELSSMSGLIPGAERIEGVVTGALKVSGPFDDLHYAGGFGLQNGQLKLKSLPSPLYNMNVSLAIEPTQVRIKEGQFSFAGGQVHLTGAAPLKGLSVGTLRGSVSAKDIQLPLAEGIRSRLDSRLLFSWSPADEGKSLPHISGRVDLKSFEYSRPVALTADIKSLAQRGKRTRFEAHDPDADAIQFDVTVASSAPLRLKNNLVDATLSIDKNGLELVGTNQRYGLVGSVNLAPGGRIRLRNNDFEIQQGYVRFADTAAIEPQVDVIAVTEYRRYAESLSGGSTNTSTAGTASDTSARGGNWVITLHAHGDPEQLKVDLTSEPALAQDDIFLLLTVGLTRAELDQSQSASLGGSVALEALGTLTGADEAVKEAVPVVDEVGFGTAYSSRTGRTEPTITIGKRLAERIRANVTSGLAESREVRSNLEWRLSPSLSVEGSYDNVNDISSSTLGNLGGDVRWRLEFE